MSRCFGDASEKIVDIPNFDDECYGHKVWNQQTFLTSINETSCTLYGKNLNFAIVFKRYF